MCAHAVAQGLKPCITLQEYGKLAFQVGTIIKAEPFPKARNPSYKVHVEFGEGKALTSSAQLPPNYPAIEKLFQRHVIALTNLPERKIAGFKSQFLIVGFPDANHHVHLLNTRGRNVDSGIPLRDNEKAEKSIAYEAFEAVDIRAAKIVEIEADGDSERDYFAQIDLGPLGMQRIHIMDIDPAIAEEIKETQIPVVVNIKDGESQQPDLLPLTFRHRQDYIPLGVDAPVENGVALF